MESSPPPRRPRVLLADDDGGICRAITRLLSPSCEMTCTHDVPGVYAAVGHSRPDVVLLDFSLPGGPCGLEVCRRVREISPETRVVVFTANDDEDLKRLAYEAGATGFVYKPQAWADLLPAIHGTAEGTATGGSGTA
jgi:DNA-binding NarL/FixJ family response regulator